MKYVELWIKVKIIYTYTYLRSWYRFFSFGDSQARTKIFWFVHSADKATLKDPMVMIIIVPLNRWAILLFFWQESNEPTLLHTPFELLLATACSECNAIESPVKKLKNFSLHLTAKSLNYSKLTFSLSSHEPSKLSVG